MLPEKDWETEIYANATRLFTEFWKGQPLRLIGVALTGLTDGSFEQMSLFEDTETKEQQLFRFLSRTMPKQKHYVELKPYDKQKFEAKIF